jgi:large subunit ribosomal protein L14
MIKLLTKLAIIDNSGGLIGRCIWLRRKTATIGDLIKVSILKTSSSSLLKKGDVHLALIVRTKFSHKGVNFNDNAIILLKQNDLSPIGTRIKGPISTKIKNKKILSLTSYQI